jgi:hypothetical protein
MYSEIAYFLELGVLMLGHMVDIIPLSFFLDYYDANQFIKNKDGLWKVSVIWFDLDHL